jgi:hypothetical protein
MWPHEIDWLYRWYVTLPATVLLLGSLMVVLGARDAYKAADEYSKRQVRFKFDETDAMVLGPLLWLFGIVVVRCLSWWVGGFSAEGRIAAFYTFYGLVTTAAVACLLVLFFFQPCMNVADFLARCAARVHSRIDAIYDQHGNRWYFVLPLAILAAVVLVAEKVVDYAYLYKWYYIGATMLFVYGLLIVQWLSSMDHYADEQSAYYLKRAGILSRWLSLFSLLVLVWMTVYSIVGVPGGTTSRVMYAPTLIYGALVWVLLALLSTWLTLLLLSWFYGLSWVKLRKLSRQLRWAKPDELSKICYRIRKIGGPNATGALVALFDNPAMPVAGRLAAAWELSELNWKPVCDQQRAWMAVAAYQWNDVRTLNDDGRNVLHDILDQTLRSPRRTADREQLSLIVVPAVRTLGAMGDARSVERLLRAVRLRYDAQLDETNVPGLEGEAAPHDAEVLKVQCAAADALKAMGPTAATALPTLKEILDDRQLNGAVREAIESALAAIEP